MLLRPLIAASVLLACAPSTRAEPFLARNQHPLVQLFGLPAPLPARLPARGTGSVAGIVNWSNFAVVQADREGEFTLDGEAVEVRVTLDRAVTPRIALHAELGWRSLDGGVLDPLIDDFHDFFQMPDGSRPRLPHDRLRIAYARHGITQLNVDADRAGLTDLPMAVGWQWLASDAGAVAAWITVKLPTGQPDELTGSGATDVALSLATQRNLSPRWQWFGQLNFARLGHGDVLSGQQRDIVSSALAGVTWRAGRGLDLTAQVDANTKVFDAGLEGLDGAAVVLTFGAGYRTQRAWRFDFGLSEDLKIDASPDVVFLIAVRHGL